MLVQRLTEAVPGNNFANLTWATRPAADGENQDSSSQAFGGEWAQSGCPTAADMVWNDVSKIGQILQRWADNPASAYGLLVRAADEGNIHAYRHFRVVAADRSEPAASDVDQVHICRRCLPATAVSARWMGRRRW